jgi:hypothetical protein
MTAGARLGTMRLWVVAVTITAVVTGCAAHQQRLSSCRSSNSAFFLLEAQAVPSAAFIPCLLPLPAGWSYSGSDIKSGLVRFWLDSDRAGPHAAEVRLARSCDVSGAIPDTSTPAILGLSRYTKAAGVHQPSSTSFFVFAGGCVTYRFSFDKESAPTLFDEADHALGFTPRSLYVKGVLDDAGLSLCGAGAQACPG